MLAVDVSTNPGPGWYTNLQNFANLIDDVQNGESNFDDLAVEMHDCTLKSNNEYCNLEAFFDSVKALKVCALEIGISTTLQRRSSTNSDCYCGVDRKWTCLH